MLKKVALKEERGQVYILTLYADSPTAKDKGEVRESLKGFVKEDSPNSGSYFAEIDARVTDNLHHVSVYSNKKRTFGQFEYFYQGKKRPYVRAVSVSFDYDKFAGYHDRVMRASGAK